MFEFLQTTTGDGGCIPYWVIAPSAAVLVAAIVALWKRDANRSAWFEKRLDALLERTTTLEDLPVPRRKRSTS